MTKFISLACIAMCMFMSTSFTSCSDDNDDEINVYEYKEQTGKKIKELSDLLVNSEYGLADGQYPEESKALLETPIGDLKTFLEQIEARKITDQDIPAETANRIEKADKAIAAFKASLRGEDDDIKKLTDRVLEITILKNDSEYGLLKGQYPVESKSILEDAITDLETLLSKIENNQIAGEEKNAATNESLSKAGVAVEEFKATIRTEDLLIPAELLIRGKNRGYINFGVSPNFSNFGEYGKQQFTVEFWTKIENMDNFVFFLSTLSDQEKEGGGTVRYGWNINVHFGNLRPTYVLGEYDLLEPGTAFNTLNTWVHIALVTNELGVDGDMDNGNPIMTKMYINGNEVIRSASHQAPEKKYKPGNVNVPLYGFMGANGDGSPQWDKGANGYMKHVHIWKTAKSQAQIQQLKDNPNSVTGTEADLVCGWKFDTVVKDNNDIKDITGNYSAKLVGDFEWKPL